MTLTVGLVQHAGFAERKSAWQASAAGVEQAAKQGAKLVVLPELHGSLYFPIVEDAAYFDLAERIPGPSTDYFSALAKEHNVVLVTSLFEKRAAGLYHNTAVVFEVDGSVAGQYRKMHIPDDPGFYEKFYFTPGDLGFQPIETSIGKLGVLICWDQWFPEAARLMALAGAEVLIYPTAIGCGVEDAAAGLKQQQLDAWQTIQRSHAIANGLPVIAVNRVGEERAPNSGVGAIAFWGHSFACGAQGNVLASAREGEAVLMATISTDDTEMTRRGWPYLRDRRIDAYQDLQARYLDT